MRLIPATRTWAYVLVGGLAFLETGAFVGLVAPGETLAARAPGEPSQCPLVSNEAVTYLVAGCCGVFAIAAYVAWILVPAWTAYTRWWERAAAAFLTLYVLAAMVGLGLLGGGAIAWSWDRITD